MHSTPCCHSNEQIQAGEEEKREDWDSPQRYEGAYEGLRILLVDCCGKSTVATGAGWR